MAVGDGLVVASAQPLDAMEVQGVNDRMQQAQLERHYQRLRAEELMRQGVTLLDPRAWMSVAKSRSAATC